MLFETQAYDTTSVMEDTRKYVYFIEEHVAICQNDKRPPAFNYQSCHKRAAPVKGGAAGGRAPIYK